MRYKIARLTFLFSFLFLIPLTLHAGDTKADALRSILSEKSQHVVSIKAVIKTEMNMGGKNRTQESTANFNGLLVNSSGVILAPRSPFRSRTRQARGQEITINKSPKTIDVIIGTDSEEYDAFLGAKDDRFGLAFIKLKNPDEVDFTPLNLKQSTTPEVAEKIVMVSRLSKTFNYAPTFNTGRVNGKVDTPRDMWALSQTPSVSLPVYSTDGELYGIVGKIQGKDQSSINSMRSMFQMFGSGGGSSIGYFLLPIDDVRQILDRAKKQIQKQQKKQSEKKESNGNGSGDEKKETEKKEK